MWEKDKLLVKSNFSFSHSVFYPFGELPAIFIKFRIVDGKLFQFGKVKKKNCRKLKAYMSRMLWFYMSVYCLANIRTKIGQKGTLNSLPNNKTVYQSKLKGFADDNINVTQKLKFIL